MPPSFAQTPSEAGDLIRRRLENLVGETDDGSPESAAGETLHARTALGLFYEKRLYRPAWSGPRRPLAQATMLASALERTSDEGLDPAAYHLDAIRDLLARIGSAGADPGLLADLDLLLTDAFLIRGAHQVSGRVDPESFDPEWIAVRREVDLVALLEETMASKRSPAEALAELAPRNPGYARLRDTLARYRALAASGGWPMVPESTDEKLEPGETDARIPLLRRRLAATGDLEARPADRLPDQELLYDDAMAEAVRRFQRRHGLLDDAAIGRKTLAAMNVAAAERVRQIELNLERWRWLPLDLGERYILVNIPDFRLELVENSRPVLTMRVVVGRPFRRTPVFSDTMRYLVLNPFWDVPHKLAVEDKLPEIQKDPTYLSRLGVRVFEGWGTTGRELDPATVDWATLSRRHFPYRLRQDPGPQNALGRIKFMFPNKFSVYLHDTPARELFSREARDFSSGCIRIERPLELAEALLADAGWDGERLTKALETERDRSVPLARPIAVHLLYWTAWVNEDGTVHFRNDLYGRDAALAQALEEAAKLGRGIGARR